MNTSREHLERNHLDVEESFIHEFQHAFQDDAKVFTLLTDDHIIVDFTNFEVENRDMNLPENVEHHDTKLLRENHKYDEEIRKSTSSVIGEKIRFEERSKNRRNHTPLVETSPDMANHFLNSKGKVIRGKPCQYQNGCQKRAQSGGLCKRHGGGKRCGIGGCNKSSQGSDGKCRKHGGGPKCIVHGCTKGIQKRGMCTPHYKMKERRDEK